MLFHKKSEESEARIVSVVGAAFVTCAVVAAGVLKFTDSFDDRPATNFGIVIETNYVGQGVQAGTSLLMHGIEVGKVVDVTSLPGGRVRLAADLQRPAAEGLTDAMVIDFRPANYFGVTGINLESAEGGQALHNGSFIKAAAPANFTLQALLSRLGEISHDVLTPRLIDVIERGTSYIDGLNPLLETMLVVSNSLANVQSVSTERLLRNATGISVALPGLTNGAIDLADHYVNAATEDVSEDFFQHTWVASLDLVSGGFFGALGKLLGSHSSDLAPVVDMVKVLTDIAPGLVPSEAIAETARELRMRLERLVAGPPDRRAINVRVVLDSLPGIAAPVDAIMGAPQ
ncbi:MULTISPECIES: Mammalian cell entry related domain protein [Mycolicibacterium]|uniref:Mammalian cell entry related domain protein n=1 Tax=Mycolicibacterium TaxID=1866885 RepID=UPI000FA48AFB|nr:MULTISPECIES: Mammalian cell entry related domain protein [Mycolicibacterium]RUP30774.1 MAG: Mammalian cell entry related domain protein [Mycolicibacterium sp.]UCZ59700.1 Mammalian cell entry related domain protein [Mycolicibacterium phocaicum]